MRIAAFCFVLGLLGSCARFQPSAVDDKDITALGIPTELQDKFAVKEAAQAAPAPPVVAPAPEPKKKLAKKKEKKEKIKKAATVVKDKWPNRWTRPPVFHPGDRVLLDITFFGATAGTLEMKILPMKVINDRKVYHVQAVAQTASIFSLFYRLNDLGETFIDQDTIVPLKFTMKMDESLQNREVVELYDHNKEKMYYWSNWDHKKKGHRLDSFELNLEEFTQDSISSFFYVRTLPLNLGDKYRFWLSTNGKLKHVQISVVRKEKLITRVGEFDTIVIKPDVILDGVLQKAGDTFIWLSDDENRSVLKIDAKIKVGSLIAYLRELDVSGVPVGDTSDRHK